VLQCSTNVLHTGRNTGAIDVLHCHIFRLTSGRIRETMEHTMKTAHLSVRIPEEDVALLKAEAARQGKGVSDILRDLICRSLFVPPHDRDRIAYLRVLKLDTRSGRVLVSPDDPGDLSTTQLWVRPDLLSDADPTLNLLAAPLASERTMFTTSVLQHEEIAEPPKKEPK
jgi:hypothetical protein